LKKLDEEFTPFDYQDLEDEDFTALFAEYPNSNNGSTSIPMHIKSKAIVLLRFL
jgi:hypothetical protein